jgi:membrane-associated phospholipid phosphatase
MARTPGAVAHARGPGGAVETYRLLGFSLVSLAGLVVVYFAAVGTTLGQRFDDSALGSLDINPSVYGASSNLLETIDVSSLAIVGVAIALLALLRRRIGAALASLVLVLGANVTTQVLKSTLPRPNLGAESVLPQGSFPSGHATVAMSLALALIIVASPRERTVAALAGGTYAAAVGAAVVLLNWHRPSDVLGAYLVCCTWFGAAALLSKAFQRTASTDSGVGGRGIALVVGATAVSAAIALAIVSRRVDLVAVVGGRTEFILAALVVIASAAVLIATAARLLDDARRSRATPHPPSADRERELSLR